MRPVIAATFSVLAGGQVAQIARCFANMQALFLERRDAARVGEPGGEKRGPAEKMLYDFDRRDTLKNWSLSASITEKLIKFKNWLNSC